MRLKGSTLPKYNFGSFIGENSDAISAGAHMASSSILAIDGADGDMSMMGSVGSGMLSGAAAGTAILPGWGTAVGAVVGGTAGAIGKVVADKAQRKALNLSLDERRNLMDQQVRQRSSERMYDANIYGDPNARMYAGGGQTPFQYEAEGDEVIEHAGEAPISDNGSRMEHMGGNLSKIHGKSHEQGGVKMKGGEYVYSDRINVPKWLNQLLK